MLIVVCEVCVCELQAIVRLRQAQEERNRLVEAEAEIARLRHYVAHLEQVTSPPIPPRTLGASGPSRHWQQQSRTSSTRLTRSHVGAIESCWSIDIMSTRIECNLVYGSDTLDSSLST